MYELEIPAIQPGNESEKRYLWLPVVLSAEKTTLRLYRDNAAGPMLWELNFRTGIGVCSYYVSLDVTELAGKTLLLDTEQSMEWLVRLRVEKMKPSAERGKRPELHFTADRGWVNDPNGLIYHDGYYHLYFQYNPYDVEWGDMHWGHAVSRNLVHWEQLENSLLPDDTGTMYSGSAILDAHSLLGYGKDSVIFYYTAAGGKNGRSQGKTFAQRIAVLPAGAALTQPLRKTGIVVLENITPENRDPKVFWHIESNAYIMVLFLENNDFGVFRSDDLVEWEMTQRLTLEDAWECPDLFSLKVEGENKQKWVFWSADGFYYVGEFDGCCFTPDGGKQYAYYGKLPYAAQTFQETPGRTVSIAWLRTAPKLGENEFYTGMMSFPVELSLLRTAEGLRLRLPMARELDVVRAQTLARTGFSSGETQLAPGKDHAFEIRLWMPCGAWRAVLRFAGQRLEIDAGTRTVQVGEEVIHLPMLDVNNDSFDFSILADYGVMELRAMRDTVYYPWEHAITSFSDRVSLTFDRDMPAAKAEISRFA